MKYLIIISLMALIPIGCHLKQVAFFKKVKPKEYNYEYLHDKYRTLWYRTGNDCFFDSCKKYGELLDKELGISNEIDIDTTQLKEGTPICK